MSSINIFDAAGKKLEAISFSLASHATNVSPVLFSQAIRVLLQNWRQGTVGCKTRGELAFSNKKPWRQKGTGRARVSSIRSPLWRKGGIIFGPQPRVRKLDINRQQNRGVMASIFAEALSENRVVAVETSFTKPSTKQAHALLQSLNLQASKTLMFAPVDDFAVRASFSNIPNVVLISFDSPNAYICAHGQNWVFFKKDLELFKAMVEKWS